MSWGGVGWADLKMIDSFQMVTAEHQTQCGPSEHRSLRDCPGHTPPLHFPVHLPNICDPPSDILHEVRALPHSVTGSPGPGPEQLSEHVLSHCVSDAVRTSMKMKRTRRGPGNKATNHPQCPCPHTVTVTRALRLPFTASSCFTTENGAQGFSDLPRAP